ncbi:TPA: hypothetical protein R4270_005290 [Klebsiella variicola subsp. variicola]|nr:hypothetical protein [Klebsiella variicola subsp. variicola]
MDELKKAILKSFEERFNSPLIGYILTSWVIYNWKPIIYFIYGKEGNIQERVKIALDVTTTYNLYILPIVTGVILTLLIPFANYIIKRITSRAVTLDEKLTELRTGEIERDKAKTLAVQAESLQKVEEAKLNIDSKQLLSKTLEGVISQLTSQKKSLEDEISSQEKQIKDINETIANKNNELNNMQQILAQNGATLQECSRLRDELNLKEDDISSLRNLLETSKIINRVVIRAMEENDVSILEEATSALDVMGYAKRRPT